VRASHEVANLGFLNRYFRSASLRSERHHCSQIELSVIRMAAVGFLAKEEKKQQPSGEGISVFGES
jgi:hypothetical protein